LNLRLWFSRTSLEKDISVTSVVDPNRLCSDQDPDPDPDSLVHSDPDPANNFQMIFLNSNLLSVTNAIFKTQVHSLIVLKSAYMKFLLT